MTRVIALKDHKYAQKGEAHYEAGENTYWREPDGRAPS